MSRNTLKIIADELCLAVRPLQTAVSTLSEFQTFLHRCGWEVSSLPPSYQDLGLRTKGLVTSISSLGDDATLSEVLDGLQHARDLVAAIRALVEAPAGVDPGLTTVFLAEMPQAILDLLLADYLGRRAPKLRRALVFTDVLVQEHNVTTTTRPGHLRTRFDYAQLPRALESPTLIPQAIYGWGTADLDFGAVARDLLQFFSALQLAPSLVRVDRARRDGYQPSPSDVARAMSLMLKLRLAQVDIADVPVDVGVSVLELPAETGGLLPGIILEPFVPSEGSLSYSIADDLTLAIRAGSDVAQTFGLLIRPGSLGIRYPFAPGTPLPTAGFGMNLVYAPPTPTMLLGRPTGTRLEIAGFDAGLTVDVTGTELELQVKLTPRNLAVVLAADDQDGFLAKLFGGEARLPLPLALKWSTRTGLSFASGNAFRVVLAPKLKIGAFQLNRVDVALEGESDPDPAAVLTMGAAVSATLGPVAVTVNRVGFQFRMAFVDGNFGPIDVDLGFQPPSGAGIAIDAGAVKGSGFLDFDADAGRYTGALALDAHGIELSAIGILDTELPSGGYSFVGIVSAEFDPIPIGLGFTLNGVGGLLALNRRIDVDALQGALADPSGSAMGDIFFPTDAVAQAARVVTDLAAYFPVAEGRYVFGPAAKIGWGTPTLVTADLALLLEVPAPVKLVLLGTAHAALPKIAAPLIVLNVDIVGVLDFERKMLGIDARLRDSKVLTFPIEGGFGLRVEWGDAPNFVVSVGGFNPRFPAPPEFLVPERVRIGIGFDDNPRLDLTGYLALTSNTAQIGARVDLYASAGGGLSITGDLGFDALFVFNPFSFTVDIAADVSLFWYGDEYAGIHVHGTLTGPSPWHVSGKACVSLWFVDLCVDFDTSFGGDESAITTDLNPQAALLAAIADPANWSGDRAPGAYASVTLAPPADPAMKLLDPTSLVRLRQTVVPLNRKITKYLGAKPVGGTVRYDVTSVVVGGLTEATEEVKDWFVPDQVEQLTDDERLSRGAYEKMTAGVSLADAQTTVGRSLTKALGYETILIRDRWSSAPLSAAQATFFPTQVQLVAAVGQAAAANHVRVVTGAAKFAPPVGTPPLVSLADEGFVVASTVTLALAAGFSAAPSARGDAYAAVAAHLATYPGDEGTLQVIPAYELAA